MTKATTDKQRDFIYEGTNHLGQKITGNLRSENLQMAKAQLRKQGIKLTVIRHKPKKLFRINQKINSLDIAIFVRQLATMIKAGVPLIHAFALVSESLKKTEMKNLLLKVKADIESGTSFANALAKHPKYFDTLFCALVESGEQSGSLETMLDRVATYKEKSEQLKSKVRKAIKYPLAVILVAMIVTFILLIKVVPVFADLFASFNAELPVFTQWVVTLSTWVSQYWYILFILITVTIVAFLKAKTNHQNFANYLDKLILRLPIFGNITYQAITARFCRTLATTFAAGVPLIDALHSTAAATDNNVFFHATQQIKKEVSTGQSLTVAIQSSQLFPSLAIQLINIGEESGSLDEMLEKVADYYEQQVEDAVDGLTSLLEPIIMVILGVLIGGLVIAMYLPIFQMGSVIS